MPTMAIITTSKAPPPPIASPKIRLWPDVAAVEEIVYTHSNIQL